MTGFGGRLAARVRTAKCRECGGHIVPTSAWSTMSDEDLLQWRSRQLEELDQAKRLTAGDALPAPLLCRCEGDRLSVAIDELRQGEPEAEA